jgi:hypothetical protein
MVLEEHPWISSKLGEKIGALEGMGYSKPLDGTILRDHNRWPERHGINHQNDTAICV